MLQINELTRLYLGAQGENKARKIEIDMSAWAVSLPNGSATIWHKRNGDENPSATGATYNTTTKILTWEPTGTDTYVAGEGEAEIRMTEGTVIKKTRTVVTGVAPAVTLAGAALGDGWQDYINAVDGMRDDAVSAKSDAEAWAKGTRDGVDVEETDPAYHNNAKYYADSAVSAAEDAEDAKDAAEDAQEAAEAAQDAAEDAQEAAEDAQEAAEDAQDAAEAAADSLRSAGAEASTLEPGSDATAEIQDVDGAKKFVFGIPKGLKGDNAYVWIKYAAAEPTQDGDMKDTADAWMGVYSGNSSTAPTAYTSYTWYQIKNDVSLEDTDETQTNLDITDKEGYVLARFYNGHIQTKNFDSSKETAGFEWKISGSDLLLSYGYTDSVDAVVVLNRGRANNLFDFAAFKTKPKGTPLSGLETTDLTMVWSSSTDMHSPFQFNAVNNADGYNASATTPGFVGGNHTLDQMGTGFETAASKYVHYFADGRPVSSGYGKAAKFEIRWANDVQAYNTVKSGGGGRVCLTEYHDMIFDGVRFEETVKLEALEAIDMRTWYGFQFVEWGRTFGNIRFIGATNHGIYTTGSVNSGSIKAKGMETYGTAHKILMTVDEETDLGDRSFVASGSNGAFTSGTKGYFRIISKSEQNVWSAESAYWLRGTYRFCPVVS